MQRPDIASDLIDLQPQLLRVARRMTGQKDAAQDLTQDVLLSLWARLQAGDEILDLRAYAMSALRNAWRQSLRARRPCAVLEEEMLITEPDVLAQLALGELDAAISRLPAEQARLIRLVAEGETSPAALARRLNMPQGTVMSRLARARARLRIETGMGAP